MGAEVEGSKWPWRATDRADRWVDDPESGMYNTWQRGDGGSGYRTWEELTMYSLGLVVRHNDAPIRAGKGSAIFMHPWGNAERNTTGCTSMAKAQLVKMLAWLDPGMAPVLVQVAGWVAE
jgi:L,D-peptidoglycan transpeptidase YkuD (ErfK/YbiS/YcfS/YnhG family)